MPVSGLRIAYAVAWRRIRHMTKYRLNFEGSVASRVMSLVFYLIFLAVIDITIVYQAVGTTNIAAFMFLGVAFVPFINVGLWESSITLASDMELGKLEYSFTCPISKYWFIVGNALGVAATNTIFFIPMFAFALAFVGLGYSVLELLLGLLAIVLSVFVLVQIGAIFSSLVLKYRKVSSLFGVLSVTFQFLGGTYVPVQTFPPILKAIALGLPNVFGIDLLRVHMLGTTPILIEWVSSITLAIALEWIILVIELVMFFLLARVAIRYGEKAAMETGYYYL
ncbi:MAG: ABC transporter permease [Candidatus Thorarchaeota archaeon]|jgi:ABC-2 type transport system permease protein